MVRNLVRVGMDAIGRRLVVAGLGVALVGLAGLGLVVFGLGYAAALVAAIGMAVGVSGFVGAMLAVLDPSRRAPSGEALEAVPGNP